MKTLFAAQQQICRIAALTCLPSSAVGLVGCSDTPHDRVDSTPPTTMPRLPESATTAAAKPAEPAVPIPNESQLGVPIYPGVKTYTDATGMAVKPVIDESMATAMLETSDTLDKVLDFYKERIKQTDARGNTTPSMPREEKVNDKRKVVLTGQ